MLAPALFERGDQLAPDDEVGFEHDRPLVATVRAGRALRARSQTARRRAAIPRCAREKTEVARTERRAVARDLRNAKPFRLEGLVPGPKAFAGNGGNELNLGRLSGARKPLMQVRRRRRNFRAEHLVPHLVIRMHRPLRGVVLIDPHDIGKTRAGLRQNLSDVAIDTPRFALVAWLAVERVFCLLDVRRQPIDVVGRGLPGGKHPASRTDAARQARAGMRIATGSSGSSALRSGCERCFFPADGAFVRNGRFTWRLRSLIAGA